MNVLWFTWKDARHPWAGGAEVVGTELRKRLIEDGHQVKVLTSSVAGAPEREIVDGVEIIRRGSQYSMYWHAYRYYRKNLVGWANLVIDEVNTLPFFCRRFVREPVVMLFHQLCREVWLYQMSFPLKYFGYLLEPLYLRCLKRGPSVAMSESTKSDLQKYGYTADGIHVISEGICLLPVADVKLVRKNSEPTLLSFGSVRSMKRAAHIVRAFELAKRKVPALRLVVAGDMDGSYGAKVKRMIDDSTHSGSISCLGQLPEERKTEVMQRAHLLAVTSVKEGWGLVVTEANSQGTPAVVYDVDGLRDSVRDGVTGRIAKQNTPTGLAKVIVEMLKNKSQYERLQWNAWSWSKEINFDRSYKDFSEVINQYARK